MSECVRVGIATPDQSPPRNPSEMTHSNTPPIAYRVLFSVLLVGRLRKNYFICVLQRLQLWLMQAIDKIAKHRFRLTSFNKPTLEIFKLFSELMMM